SLLSMIAFAFGPGNGVLIFGNASLNIFKLLHNHSTYKLQIYSILILPGIQGISQILMLFSQCHSSLNFLIFQ
ncbi:hypothetical protein D3Z38_10330, partial [Clostridiales bacterium]|nr:hypothetical protein [Clostridiales bacterium]